MSLRTRLILAFLLLSVVPLTAVTLYSYATSVRAFQHAVEREEAQTAGDIGRRMTLVTHDVGQRLDRFFAAQTPEEMQGVDRASMVQRLAPFLGDTAMLLERLEFQPMPRGTTGQPTPPAPAAPSAAPAPPSPPAPPPAIVIDVPAIVREARKAARSGDTSGASSAFESQIAATVQRSLEQGFAGAAIGMRAAADAIARQQAASASSSSAAPMRMEGRHLDVPVRRNGQVVGRASAQINMDRMLSAVLTLARSDQGEIPFAIDAGGRLHTPDASQRPMLDSLGVPSAVSGTRTRREGDWLIVTRKDEPSGITFGIARPLGASLREIRRASVRNLLLGLGVIAIALIGIVPISHRMTGRLRALTGGVRRLSAGDYHARVDARSADEFGELARAFNQMAQGLEQHQAMVVEQERLRRELELSRQIQTEMLPHAPLRLGATEIKGISIPAREVGGDFFNYFELPDGRVGLLVGDVSGKGVSAALLMANVQATLRARLPLQLDLAALADTLDRDLDASTPRSVFVTLFLAVLEDNGRTLRYVNAGHHPQYVLRSGGGVEAMGSTGLPIALFGGHGYSESRVSLAPGDLIFFYTDGLVETMNDRGDLFGAERVQAVLADEHTHGLDVVLQRMEEEVRNFRGTTDPLDDATMMAMRV
jgi:serine phosphatase RsbU (regulator of sigma subunit)